MIDAEPQSIKESDMGSSQELRVVNLKTENYSLVVALSIISEKLAVSMHHAATFSLIRATAASDLPCFQ